MIMVRKYIHPEITMEIQVRVITITAETGTAAVRNPIIREIRTIQAAHIIPGIRTTPGIPVIRGIRITGALAKAKNKFVCSSESDMRQ
jgi:hypothetical protein